MRRSTAATSRSSCELLDPEIEWHEPGDSPEAGTHHGRDSFERFFRSWIDSFDGFRVEPEEVVERGDKLIAVVHQSGRGRRAESKWMRGSRTSGPSRTAARFDGRPSRTLTRRSPRGVPYPTRAAASASAGSR